MEAAHIRLVLGKNMDILAAFVNKWIFFFLKVYILRKLPQRQHFWLNQILVRVIQRVLEIEIRSAFYEISFGHLVFYRSQSTLSKKSYSLFFLALLSDQFGENKFLFPLF